MSNIDKRTSSTVIDKEPRRAKKFRKETNKKLDKVLELIQKQSQVIEQQSKVITALQEKLNASSSSSNNPPLLFSSEIIDEPENPRGLKKVKILNEFFLAKFDNYSPEEVKQLIGVINFAALFTCQDLAERRNDAGKLVGKIFWKRLEGFQKKGLIKYTQNTAVEARKELGFIRRCRNNWIALYVLQPRWSGMPSYRIKDKK